MDSTRLTALPYQADWAILGFTEAANWAARDEDHNETNRLRGAIAPNVRAIHPYWLGQRMRTAPVAPAHPVKRTPER